MIARVRPHAALLATAALVTWLSWPAPGRLHPRLDLDGAWAIGLRAAIHDGLNFGTDVVFTFGPLGFLHEPLVVYPWTARLGFAFVLLIQFALCLGLIAAARRSLGSLLAAALAALVLSAALAQEPLITLVFGASVVLIAGLLPATPLAAAAGVLCGIELLIKLNIGITVTALAIVGVLAMPAPRGRPALAFTAGLVAAFALGWLLTGQSLAALPGYLTGSLAIVSGYSEAMVFEDPLTAWEYLAAVALTAVGFVVAFNATAALGLRARAGALLLWAIVAFTTYKAGFVRHDPLHTNVFFASLLGGIVAFAWAPHRRRTALLLGLLFLLVLIGSSRTRPSELIAPYGRAKAFVVQAALLADGSATNEEIAKARAERFPVQALDPGLADQARKGGVHFEPADAGAPWASGLEWRPLPVFQSYSAYTRDLDERNAATARDEDGPRWILRENNNTIDSRNPAFESPEAMREVLCHFRAAQEVVGRWILLERTQPRCGRPRLLETTTAELGKPAPVPEAPGGEVVFARIDGIAVGGLERLRALLYRAKPRSIALDGGRIYKLVPGTAGDGLVLRVPPDADLPAPFNLDQATDTVTITRGNGDQGRVTMRFFAMRID